MLREVRIPEKKLAAIIAAFKHHFHPQDHLWLFGSRVDLNKRGGDIDLYIETTESDLDIALQKRRSFVVEIWNNIGEQKIDVVLNTLSTPFTLPIYDVAKKNGVQLV